MTNSTVLAKMKNESALLDIRVLLFDVGGVLVQLSGVETMLEWLGKTVTAESSGVGGYNRCQ